MSDPLTKGDRVASTVTAARGTVIGYPYQDGRGVVRVLVRWDPEHDYTGRPSRACTENLRVIPNE